MLLIVFIHLQPHRHTQTHTHTHTPLKIFSRQSKALYVLFDFVLLSGKSDSNLSSHFIAEYISFSVNIFCLISYLFFEIFDKFMPEYHSLQLQIGLLYSAVTKQI
jgi:hypothetical protein